MRGTAWLLGSIILLAGCTGNDAGSDLAAPAPQPDEDSGSITGIVIDDNLRPIANAQIGIPPIDAITGSDAEGAFTLNGIPPGEHTLVAQALGYEPFGRKVTVVAGEVLDVGVELQPLPIRESHMEMIPKKGYWTLAADTVIAVPSTGVANSEHRVNFDVGEDWNTTQVELFWKYSNPGQATTPGAWWNNQAQAEGDGAKNIGEVFGRTAPIKALFMPGVINRGDGYKGETRPTPPEDAYNHNMYVFPLGLLTDETQPVMAAGFGNAPSRGVGVSFQQPFEVYISIFYVEGPPADYTALPDQ